MPQVKVIQPIAEQAKKLRVAAYARVSSDSADQLNSFATQVDYYTSYIQSKDEWEFAGLYADEAVSGTTADKRSDFQRLLADCRAGKIDRILVKSISRFARNTIDCIQTVRELKQLGIAVEFEKEDIDTGKMGSEMLLSILGSAAQEESLSISKNLKWSIRKRMQKGDFITCRAPYGYILSGSTLEIFPPEAKVIRFLKECQIERLFSDGEYEKACTSMQKLIDELEVDDTERGWYLQQLARYTYPISAAKSIQIQKSAFKKNSQLLKPSSGIEYTKVSYLHENRLNNIRKYLLKYTDYTELSLAVDAILENLSFGTEATKFESALKDIGDLLGYISQRPDNEIRKGPDNLWCGVNNHYLLFECKSEVSETRQSITKLEAGQMNNHCAWFDDQYGTTARVDRFMIIPTKELSYEGDFSHDVRIIRRNKLRNLKDQIKKFIKELKPYNLHELSDDTIQRSLDLHHLNVEEFSEQYSEKYFHKTK